MKVTVNFPGSPCWVQLGTTDVDAAKHFYGQLFGWTFPDGGMPGYTYVDTGVEGAVPGGISPLQGGGPLVTFFVGVPDVAATLEAEPGNAIPRASEIDAMVLAVNIPAQLPIVGQALRSIRDTISGSFRLATSRSRPIAAESSGDTASSTLISSCPISCCREKADSISAASYARRRIARPSSCSPPRDRRSIKSWAWSWAPTIT